MKCFYFLGLVLALISLVGCEKEKPDLSSICAGYTRSELIRDIPALVIAQKIGGQLSGSYIIQPTPYSASSQSPTPWRPCNLSQQFQIDTLKIRVSGYLLTYPGLELMNIAQLPFEITDIQLRN